jgi:hypothetical protein
VLYQACHGNLLKPNAWCLMQGQLLSRGQFLIPFETQNLTVSLYSELPLLCHACLSPYIYIYLGLESLGWLLAMLCSKTALGKLEKHYSSDCFELLVVY